MTPLMRARAAAMLPVALVSLGAGPSGSAGVRQSTPQAARAFIVAAENNRIVLPDGLHTPA
ncbi:MAG: hypothetical protein ABJC89_27635, partial [Acidobacteriota bacterium]